MAERDINQPDIIQERIELRPALSSTGDRPVFLAPPEPLTPDPAPEPPAEPPAETPAEPSPEPTPDPEPSAAPPDAAPPASEPKPDPRTTRAREAEARAERLERLLGDAIQALSTARQTPEPAPPAPPPPPEPPAPDPRPTRAQFDDPEAYDAALVEWASTTATRRALAEHEARQAERSAAQKIADEQAVTQRTQIEQAQVVWDTHVERAAKFTETHPDYQDVVVKPNDIFRQDKPGTFPLVQAIQRAEDGPAIAYWLAQNRTEEARITGLTDPVAVLVEVGRISARLAQPKPVEVSRTPAPITPVSGNALAAGKDPNEMTAEEWARHTGRDKPQFRPFFTSSGQRPH